MGGERDEVHRLVDELPDNEVPVALTEMRRHLRPVRRAPWPPAFFGAGRSGTPGVADRVDETLVEGFGES
jgi:hypothetical protein